MFVRIADDELVSVPVSQIGKPISRLISSDSGPCQIANTLFITFTVELVLGLRTEAVNFVSLTHA